MQIICPCQDCEERSIRCHVNCERYKQYRQQMNERKAERDRYKERSESGRRKYINNKSARDFYVDVMTKRR